jgi:hypothetical protein
MGARFVGAAARLHLWTWREVAFEHEAIDGDAKRGSPEQQ